MNPYLVRSTGVGVCAQARPGGPLLHYGVLRACGFAAGVDHHASLTAAGHETTQRQLNGALSLGPATDDQDVIALADAVFAERLMHRGQSTPVFGQHQAT